MSGNLGTFASKNHGLGDGHLTIVGFAVEIAAAQNHFLLQF
jgi:hypothetical protein